MTDNWIKKMTCICHWEYAFCSLLLEYYEKDFYSSCEKEYLHSYRWTIQSCFCRNIHCEWLIYSRINLVHFRLPDQVKYFCNYLLIAGSLHAQWCAITCLKFFKPTFARVRFCYKKERSCKNSQRRIDCVKLALVGLCVVNTVLRKWRSPIIYCSCLSRVKATSESTI